MKCPYCFKNLVSLLRSFEGALLFECQLCPGNPWFGENNPTPLSYEFIVNSTTYRIKKLYNCYITYIDKNYQNSNLIKLEKFPDSPTDAQNILNRTLNLLPLL
jgi:hypothetical protein